MVPIRAPNVGPYWRQRGEFSSSCTMSVDEPQRMVSVHMPRLRRLGGAATIDGQHHWKRRNAASATPFDGCTAVSQVHLTPKRKTLPLPFWLMKPEKAF